MTKIHSRDAGNPAYDWYTLDNAAKIYPSTASEHSPAVFRLFVTLKEPVKSWILQQAIEAVMPRFPYFQVYLRRGWFWYYLQRHHHIPRIRPLEPTPVSRIPVRAGSSHLLHVSAGRNIIAVDFSHILTDGNGGIRFLISLIAEYLRLCGMPIGSHENFLHPQDPPHPEEYEDAYKRYFIKGAPGPGHYSPAYHIPGRPAQAGRFRTITGRISVDQMLDRTRKEGVTLTEYLAALMIYCLARIYQEEVDQGKKHRRSIIRLEVPVNLRSFYPSGTMRNFSLYVSPEIDMKLGPYDFEELLKHVHHSMRIQINRKELSRQISRNVGAEFNPLIRFLPLFIKDRFVNWIHSRMGERLYSGVLSNLGKISLPAEMESSVQSIHVVLSPNRMMKTSCTVIGYQNDIHINFCSLVESRNLERLFFTHLVEYGISVHIKES
ncbi:MAG TPA: hypothetical protein ENN17_11670 [bacterium]|nr:hypothetical protein [bacterium]